MNLTDKLPYGKISTVEDIGRCIRARRKAQGATQAEFAALCGVGVRFISELENGKPTMGERGRREYCLFPPSPFFPKFNNGLDNPDREVAPRCGNKRAVQRMVEKAKRNKIWKNMKLKPY
ncbi:helix-turn-helix protein [bacterium BMS3Abin12]|nr:helix-turn-helix protein [bacterium BMS3Abin12]GBE49232.1 helix-turn-helix protein [bacterium BMS3Bbin13]